MSQDGAQEIAKLSPNGILDSEFEVWMVVGLSWLMLELCCDISGSKMAAKMAILAIKNAKMSQDGAQEAAKLS